MRLGLNTSTTLPYDLNEEIPALSKYGYQGVEIRRQKLDRYLEKYSISDIQKLSQDYGIEVFAIGSFPLSLFSFTRVEKELVEKFYRALEVSQATGCSLVLLLPDIPPYEMEREKVFDVAAQQIVKYLGKAKQFGVRLAMEPVGGSYFVPGPREALELAGTVDDSDFGLLIDFQNLYRSGVTDVSIREIPVEKLFLVHVNDSEGLPDILRPLLTKFNRLYPGLGVLPVKNWLTIIKGKDYDGYYSIEIFREEYFERNVEQIIKECKEHFLRIWGEI